LETEAVTQWQFDSRIAEIFVSHARQHIPGYERVIDKSVDFLSYTLEPNDAIIDIGCATGHTLKRLSAAGFVNLHGVDNSASMLAHVPADLATLTCSDRLPTDTQYRAVIMNWTLHFVRDKIQYLQNIWTQLEPGGYLILSDKTHNQGVKLDLYHDYKRSRGVSDQEVVEKAQAVKNVMFVDSQQWYLDTLVKLGFQDITIIDADWCFTSFLAIKP
jgi:tRNA (cmo5U34)-methyltransferase